jgi:hypothetical protein
MPAPIVAVDPAKEWQSTPVPPMKAELVAKEGDLPERPACFGNCAELSSACDGCELYNPCRKASA